MAPDAPFRRLCARGGAALLCGEMLSAQAIKFNNAKTLHLLEFFPDERPLSSQICGSEPELTNHENGGDPPVAVSGIE